VSRQDPPNAAERRRWNDPGWLTTWLERQTLTSHTTDALLRHLAPATGERVLEIGSGTGRLSETLAGLLGPGGAVVGADLSEGLTALARERASRARLANVSFVVADAQVDSLGDQPFDAVVSQFGVMFFDDSTAAFSNLARHLVPDGRLAFVTWRGAEANPWYVMEALAPFLPEERRPDPAATTGPFSMADAGRVAELLDASGWKDPACTPYHGMVVVERAVLLGSDGATIPGVADADLGDALEAVENQLGAFRHDDTSYEVPIAFQVFSARRG
jgi:SAM-dependent methyltransferase